MKKVLLLAGEESGLLYAREIAEHIRKLHPEVEIRGYGDYGFETHDLAVMGFVPVLMKLRFFLRVKKTMEKAIEEWKPDVVLTVDYPGMNLKLAAHAKKCGIKAVHVVCPQVWAWKQGRIPKIEASVDKLCCFFPFEPKLFKPGLAEFVGHPLAYQFEREKGVGSREEGVGRKLVALLPGSRMGEIEKILPIIVKSVENLDVDMVIPAASERAEKAIKAILKDDKRFKVQRGGARELLRRADCAVVASGTATLEAALARCPTVLVYKCDWFMATFLRFAIKAIKHVGLANIIWEKCDREAFLAGKSEPMPELLQEKFTAEATREYIDRYLNDLEARKATIERLDAAMSFLTADGNPLAHIAAML